MEKTINIVIASTQFALEERAYEKLHAYLQSLKAHFATPEGKEILHDIESRVAEKLLEKKHAVITEADVDVIMAEMGDASELDSEDAQPAPAAGGSHKKLYRDQDDALIGGVSSGIAAYLDVDPIFVRAAFIVTAFFGGTGIWVYLLLWVLMPAATSASQKLEMRGSAVTLDAIKRMVHERTDEIRKRGTFKKFIYFPFEVLGAILRFLTGSLLPVLARVFGVLCAAGAFFGAIGLTILLGIIVSNWNASYVDLPLQEIVSPLLWGTVLVAGYLAALIPLVLIFSLGWRLVRGRSLFPSSIGLGLIGLWALVAVVAGVSGARIGSNYYSYVSTSPEYQEVVQTLAPGEFASIAATEKHVTIKNGPAYAVELRGVQMDMDNIVVENKEGVLSIGTHFEAESCIFCRHSSPSVTVIVPYLDQITLRDASIQFESYADDSLSIDARNSSASGRLTVASLILKAEDSYVGLEGAAGIATVTLDDSRFAGEDFLVQTSTLSLSDSSATINSSTTPVITRNSDSVVMDADGNQIGRQE
ncbi:MAG: phage shock protein PspC [Candidatus Adlerbacteria bacterium]|nr:phage shock protein PspC [Candidatus Adlerbacteria bacterium]